MHKKNNIIIGKQVQDRGLDVLNNKRFFKNFKRGIGANIQGFLPELDGKNITFEEIGEYFLNEIIKELKEIPDSLIFNSSC